MTGDDGEVKIFAMTAVEFTAELSGADTLAIPPEIASQLPKAGRARIIVLTDDRSGVDKEWRATSYEQFLADDAPEDAVYEYLR